MSETSPRDYQLILDMSQEEMTVPGKNFHVHLAGKTNNAHQSFVNKFKGAGQHQVSSPEESHYLVVFCPIVSRVGTDISDALDNMPGGTPVILVVMHHTFNPDHVVAPSRRQVDNARVILTVDTLFYGHEFLRSNRNDIAWNDIQTCLGPSQDTTCQNYLRNWLGYRWKLIVLAFVLVMVLVLIILILLIAKK